MGEYAKTTMICMHTCSGVNSFKSLRNCNTQISSFKPNSYSSLDSPTHRIGVTPCCCTKAKAWLISTSVSLKILRLSE